MCWTALTANCFSICRVLGVVLFGVVWVVAYVFVVGGVFGVKVLGIHLDVLAAAQLVRVVIIECEVIVQVVVGQKP